MKFLCLPGAYGSAQVRKSTSILCGFYSPITLQSCSNLAGSPLIPGHPANCNTLFHTYTEWSSKCIPLRGHNPLLLSAIKD